MNVLHTVVVVNLYIWYTAENNCYIELDNYALKAKLLQLLYLFRYNRRGTIVIVKEVF